ncbi:Membrane-bound lytic murein transglycosylase B precursor [Candidatus Rhodobacter oscarellae]|uniref:Membrane-bound lytic murein transglycosylase B n=1 Tax=Candidatus Rhodobacter oscarellae TaxID=1675527 RepID=A0A0J9EG49_9RHOB|nr:lytic murein transglycosylase [Candidatus Rhodobacter lobularis]KMW60639.1 Membrane-bound lytic murein transglycosylase B precursor [Candidatus Rhodobacter lobularis]
MRLTTITLLWVISASTAAAQSLAVERSLLPEARPGALPESTVNVEPASASLPSFADWVIGFRKRALAQGIRGEVFDRAFSGVRFNADIIARDRNQSEFTKQIWEYLETAVSPARVKNGRAALNRQASVLAKIEARYGVDKEIVTAIWGLESAYGTFRGNISAIEALATLAFDTRRSGFFEKQLVSALRILQAGDVSPGRMTGSWAGAMGHTQFMPASYLAHAQDFDRNGRRDIWGDDPADALASAAAYLAANGWTKGQPWGMEVTLPKDFDYAMSTERVKQPTQYWLSRGVQSTNGLRIPRFARTSILLPAGHRGPAFLIFPNFQVLETYNTADAYVIGVGQLADEIGGGAAIKAGWPRDERALSFTEKQEMQRLLVARGFDPQGVDGIIGPRTIAAVQEFQKSIGWVPDGYVSARVLQRLRRN